MKTHGIIAVFTVLLYYPTEVRCQCRKGQAITFTRWSGVTSDRAPPVFVYSASGEEESLVGACLARCRELADCDSVIVVYGKGNCQGIAATSEPNLKVDHDVAYFKKMCMEVPDQCAERWWTLEVTPGYHLHSDGPASKAILNTTIEECYRALILHHGDRLYRSAQWTGDQSAFDPEVITISNSNLGNCILNTEDKFTEPESYRVANYYTFYLENQCRHDYLKKIDRCSYEEYFNQTLRHVEYTLKNYTKDDCKRACENEQRFICRGFTWLQQRRSGEVRGLCDLHSEDMVTTGSWLLRRTAAATYYRRVICLNISVDCEGSDLIVTYRPRGVFRGRVYVPGRDEKCGARGQGGPVKLVLPLQGDCDVNFAYGISQGPNGLINRTMAYVMVMIQNNPIIQTSGDRWVRVGCSQGARAAHVDTTVSVRDSSKPVVGARDLEGSAPAAASAVYGASTSPLTMYVVRTQDNEATSSAVLLGEPLELRIETTDHSEIDAYHLVATSRLGDSSVLLLDSKGCPTGQIDFPALTRSWISGTQRLTARFKAFRFPTSHVVRFTIMVRFCDGKCPQVNCGDQRRTARQTNATSDWDDLTPPAKGTVVAQSGVTRCLPTTTGDQAMALECEMVVDSRDILSADTLVRADHRANIPEERAAGDASLVCVHELLLVALALAWLAVQVLLLLGCCVLVKRYRNLAELSMQKDYHSFDNVGFDTISTHRRVHWPDQSIDILHTT